MPELRADIHASRHSHRRQSEGGMMRIIQDISKGIYPTLKESEEALEYLRRILPDIEHTTCGDAVGNWRMLQNGSTCFYCPPIIL